MGFSKRTLRAAVVGAGSMGRNHIRVLSDLSDVELVAVADLEPGNLALALRGRTAVKGFTDVVAMLEGVRPDFVVVSVPTRWHSELVETVLDRGAHCLVEKPISMTRDEALAMTNLAAAKDVHLGVGHVERYNPAILQLRDRIVRGEAGRVLQLVARRTGPFPARVQDVGVIIDLAIHDIDVMLMLTLSSVTRVYAEAARLVHEKHEDLFSGTLRFDDGQVGLLDVNWLTPFKTRELTVVCERGTFVANYLGQELTFYENARAAGEWESLATLTGVAEGDVVRHHVHRVEPLRAELEAFADAVRGEGYRYVSGDAAIAALEVTTALLRAVETGQTVLLPQEEAAPSHGSTQCVSG